MAQENLTNSEVYELAVRYAPIGVALVALDGRWLQVNRALCDLLGRSESEMLATSFQQLTHPEDLDSDLELLLETLAGVRSGYRMEKRYLKPDGSTIWAQLDVVLVRRDSEPLYFISQLQDLGPRKEAEARLRQLALHDPLTDLPNRILMRDRLEQALRRSLRSERTPALGFIDLDDFKFINDTRGHEFGDRLLVEVGRRLSVHLRPEDTLARFGGDEFVILLDEVADETDAAAIAYRLLACLRDPIVLGDEEHLVSASVGLVVAQAESTAEDLLRHADLAMYAAKQSGKNRLMLYDAGFETSVRERLAAERELAIAADRGQFVPAYQPVVDLIDRSVVGFEMLARWKRTDGSLVAAGEFINVAMASGLLPRMSTQLLAHLDQDLHLLDLGPSRFLLINLSPDALSNPAMCESLDRVLAHIGDPAQLVLEITESELLHLDGSAAAALARYRQAGLRLSVDDFGTGYSSLGALLELRPEILKIDKSFVQAVDEPRAAIIVKTLCRMAEELDIMVIGEGVERPEQAETLVKSGCLLAQGFLFAQPVLATELGGRPIIGS